MHRNPSVCVVIASYNAASTIEKAVSSVLGQNYPNLQLLVVDGASTDSTISILEKITDSRLCFVSEPDKGLYDAWNKAVRISTAERVIFIGADDYLYSPSSISDFWKLIPETIHENPMIYGDLISLGIDGSPVKKIGKKWRNPWSLAGRHIWTTFDIPTMAIFFSRNAIISAGGFDDKLRIMADIDLILKIARTTPPVYVSSTVITAMGHGGISTRPEYAILSTKEARGVRKSHGLGVILNIEFLFRTVQKFFLYMVGNFFGKKNLDKLLLFIDSRKRKMRPELEHL